MDIKRTSTRGFKSPRNSDLYIVGLDENFEGADEILNPFTSNQLIIL